MLIAAASGKNTRPATLATPFTALPATLAPFLTFSFTNFDVFCFTFAGFFSATGTPFGDVFIGALGVFPRPGIFDTRAETALNGANKVLPNILRPLDIRPNPLAPNNIVPRPPIVEPRLPNRPPLLSFASSVSSTNFLTFSFVSYVLSAIISKRPFVSLSFSAFSLNNSSFADADFLDLLICLFVLLGFITSSVSSIASSSAGCSSISSMPLLASLAFSFPACLSAPLSACSPASCLSIFLLIIPPMIGTLPNNLSATLIGLNCFTKSLNANLVLSRGPVIPFSSSMTGLIKLAI